jgi:hypothetical protein
MTEALPGLVPCSAGLGPNQPERNDMRKLLRRLASLIGWRTSYHVAATYQQDSHVGWSVLSMTCEVTPWLHADNYAELMDYVKAKATRPASMPTITSITRLGA